MKVLRHFQAVMYFAMLIVRPLSCCAAPTFSLAPTLSLGLRDAISRAIQTHLATLTAAEKQKEAQGRELEALSQLLPNFYATAFQSNNTSNLAATGFPIKSFLTPINPIIGPYNTFDARLQLAQTLFNLSAYRRHQAAESDSRIAGLQADLSKEQVAAATGIAYLNVLASEQAAKTAHANLELAESLAKLAQDQHDAGIATGVDLARAQTRLASQQVAVDQAETAASVAQTQLKRLTGIPLDTQLTLTDALEFNPRSLPHANDLGVTI